MKKKYQLAVVQNGRCGVAHINNEKEVLEGPFATREEAAAAGEPVEGAPCPLCGQGHIIRGKTAYGCSRWKEGCTYRVPFVEH